MGWKRSKWIKWEGGECPVDPDKFVRVKFRGYEKLSEKCGYSPANFANRFDWSHPSERLGGDIVAYKILELNGR